MRLACPLLVALLLAFGTAVVSGAAEVPNRSEYVVRLERICKPRTEATQLAVDGVEADVRSEHLRRAAPKVAKAKRIFAKTVSLIAQVPRPKPDLARLERWFSALRREIKALQQTEHALREDDVASFQRVWADFIHQANKANNVVVAFGFNYCSFKSTRFR